jgi:hypothetical protein
MLNWLNKYLVFFGLTVGMAPLCVSPSGLLRNYWFCIAMIVAMSLMAIGHLVAMRANKVHVAGVLAWAAIVAFYALTLPPKP